MPEEAQYRGVIAMRHGRKELEPLSQQYHLGAMLILPSHKQVKIAVAGQDRPDAPAGLPIAIRNGMAMEFGHSRVQYGQRPDFRSKRRDDVGGIQFLHRSHTCLARPSRPL